MADDPKSRLTRLRKEPPPLVPVTVIERVALSPRLVRVTVEGAGLCDLVVEQAASSVRLLVPTPGSDELVIPEWNGNEFLLPDASRPVLRTFTPLRVDNAAGRLDLEIVRHPGGAVAGWAESAHPGAPAAISGPGNGFELPDGVTTLLALGDETALPAIRQLLATIPPEVHVHAHVEVVRPDAIIDLEVPDGSATIDWHITDDGDVPGAKLVAMARSIDALTATTHVWAAGEASAMQAIRTHLFKELEIDRSGATVRGYWKPAR